MLPFSDLYLESDWALKDHDEEGICFALFVTLQELRHLTVILPSLTQQTQGENIPGQFHAASIDLQGAVPGTTRPMMDSQSYS